MPSSSPLGSVRHLHPSRSSARIPNLLRRCTQINQYPSLELSRTADGGWRMENMWVSVCCWRGNPVNPNLWCTRMRGRRGTVWSTVCTHARGAGSLHTVPACTAEVLRCFRPIQVEYEALLSPGGPYSRGIVPGQQRHLS